MIVDQLTITVKSDQIDKATEAFTKLAEAVKYAEQSLKELKDYLQTL